LTLLLPRLRDDQITPKDNKGVRNTGIAVLSQVNSYLSPDPT